MKKTLFFLIFLLGFSLAAEDSYLIEDLGTFATFDRSDVIDLNENGDVLFRASNTYRDHIISAQTFLRTKEGGLICLEVPDHVSNDFHLVNNKRTCLSSQAGDVLLWRMGELKPLPLDKPNKGLYVATDLNDADQVLVNLYEEGIATKNYLWEKERCVELPIARQLDLLGFCPQNVELIGINNSGEILGTFLYGIYHRYKPDKWISLGRKVFKWDGALHLVDVPKNFFYESLKINEKGQVIFSCYSENDGRHATYVWTAGEELFYRGSFYAFDWSEDGKILGFDECGRYVVSHHDHLLALPSCISVPFFKEEEGPMDRWSCLTDLKKINSRGQIIGNGWYYGEFHGFLLNPHKNLNLRDAASNVVRKVGKHF